MTRRITNPHSPAMDELHHKLAGHAKYVDEANYWPRQQLTWCGQYGVYEWFFEPQHGGQGWHEADIFRGYLRLSAACLTTTFIITQRMGACRRVAASPSPAVQRWLPGLVRGERFATVGISHLTTSRRHLEKPALRAEEVPDGLVLEGFSPWVTGAVHADLFVLGATLNDGRQVLVAVPADAQGVQPGQPAHLVGLTASQTGPIHCRGVHVPADHILAGPSENVMKQGSGAHTGGLQTSTLAIGLADAALGYLEEEGKRRGDLNEPAVKLRDEWSQLQTDLLRLAAGEPICSNEQLRIRANSLVLRAAQAALAAAKGAGYVIGHPAGRWCREALFFLVWSCPQPVMAANLCELAGIGDE